MFNLKRNQIIITVLVFMIAIAAYLNTQQPAESFDANYIAKNGVTETEEVDFFEGYDEQLASAQTQNSQDIKEVPSQVTDSTEQAIADNTKQATVDHTESAVVDHTELAVADSAQEPNESLTLDQANSTESISAVITKKSEADTEGSNVAASKNIEVSYFAEEKLLREQSRAEQVEKLTEWVANDNLDQDSKSKAAANLIQIQERIEKENSAEALLKAKGFSEVYVRIDDDTVDVVVNKAELTESEIAQIEEIVNRKTGYSVGKINITPLNGVAKTN